ncbi:MAG TPA: lysylphosphatidylglycerol synthase domain-containing protein [Polyangia bacterium]
MRKLLARTLPWLVTAVILVLLFKDIPLRNVVQAADNAATWFIPVTVLIVLGVYIADSLAIWKTFGWFVTRLSFKETLILRGSTYLIALINYTLGQGAFVYFLKRMRGVPMMRAAAAVLLIMGTNMLLLLLLSTVGLVLGAESFPQLRTVLLVSYIGLAVYIVLLLWRPAFLTKRPLLDVLLDAGILGHVKALSVRVPHLITLLTLNYFALHAFGVPVPMLETMLAMPVVFFVAVLPISFQGLGPTQGAMIYFFARFAQGDAQHRSAQVLAASLGAQAIAWLVQITVGLICTRSQLGQSLRATAKEIPAES